MCFNSLFEHKTICSNRVTMFKQIHAFVQTYNSLFKQIVGTCGKCGFKSLFEHIVLCSNIKLFVQTKSYMFEQIHVFVRTYNSLFK